VAAGELSKAYRQLSRLVHPDKDPRPEARAAFEQLQQAYSELRDADKLVGPGWRARAGAVLCVECVRQECD
jgi:curved DNA-binding protein CbpA